MANLTFKGIGKTYSGREKVVADFNLETKDDEFIIFVGPSGCGKSTVLRMIAGLEDISEGELYIGDELVNEVEPKDRDIAMVFQNYALYPHMSVYDNMAFGLKMRKLSKSQIDEKVREASKVLGIESLLDRKPKELSGGQRQRVALGRAIVRSPQVFLMDEPLSNLDAKLRVQMRSEIVRLHKKLRTTFVYVTHDQTEAMTMGDKIVVINAGKIQQFAPPQELYNCPKNLFVAGFIGSPQMNFLEVELLENGQVKLECGAKLNISEQDEKRLTAGGYLGKNLVLGIRPEHVRENISYMDGQTLEAVVESIENMGSEKHVFVKLNGDKVVFKAPQSSDLNIDDLVDLRFDSTKLHFFDMGSEERI